MSAIRRAVPFLVASAAGIVSGIYIFKPLILEAQETGKLSSTSNQQNIIGSDGHPKGQNSTNDKETQ